MSRTPIGVAIGFGVGIAVHLVSPRPKSGRLNGSIRPTKYLVLVTPEDSA